MNTKGVALSGTAAKATSGRKRYPTDLTDREWAILEPLIPGAKPGGRPPAHERREIMNAILYVLRGGNSWRMVPHDLPPWQTAYYYFRRWSDDGTWEAMHTTLRERLRVHLGREPTPSAASLDSQSVKTSAKGGSVGSTAASS